MLKKFLAFCLGFLFLGLWNFVLAEGEEEMQRKMHMQVGEYSFTVLLEDNATTEALWELLKSPLELEMEDYGGFEKTASLPIKLPTVDAQRDCVAGDLVYYNQDKLVVFYKSNSWSYSYIGKIEDITELEKAIAGKENITVVFSRIEEGE